jgi:NAD(P)-dependent dehydrogenase (short-subunit alcohol dehydrogenase family)
MASAIVTGSDSGIGRASAVALAARGFDVGVTWHEDEDGALASAAEVRERGARAEVRRLDLSRAENGPPAIEELAGALGGLDALVNNAATGATEPFLQTSIESWRHVLEVDLLGAFLCAQAAARLMVRQGRGGRIVNVTSIHEHVPLPGASAYCAAKGGLGLLSKVMALELAVHGIAVNAVAPGEIATPMTGHEDVDPHAVDRPYIPARRPGDANEIAAIVAWLCSPESSYATGSSFVVDGGLTLMAAVQQGEAPA